MQINAICTDIDGTLLNGDRVLSPRLLQAIAKLPKDFPIILASSRMPDAMRHLQQDMGRLGEPLICYNGGFVIHDEQEEVVHDTPILLEHCEALVDIARGTEIHVSLYQGEKWYEPEMDYWAQREARNTRVEPTVKQLDQVLEMWKSGMKGAHKVMCMGAAEEIELFYRQAEQHLGSALHLYRSKDTYIEIAPKTISKASALALLLERKFGIGMDEVMAFGDNYNDMEMLQAVGLGVAMGNAREEVKSIADRVTLSNKEDGVALMIEELLLA